MWLRSWTVSLKLAFREMRRSKGRTALVMLLIGAPVLALAFIAVSYDTFNLTAAEKNARNLGTADGLVYWASTGPLHEDGTDSPAPPVATDADLLKVLPAGSSVARVQTGGGQVRVHTATGIGGLPSYYLPIDDPVTQGIVTRLRGTAPKAADEVAITEDAVSRLGVDIGGSVRLVDPDQSYKVTEVVELPDDLSAALVFPPSALPAEPGGSWLIKVPGGITPQVADHLKANGLLWSHDESTDESMTASDFELPVIVCGLIAFEVILLCGPAFAVGARRRQRDLALVAANGGTAKQLRRIVLADGLLLGLAGSVVGVVLGTPLAVIARPFMETLLVHRRSGALRFFPEVLAAGIVLAAVTGVLAALFPAINAARQNVVAALAGRRGIVRSRKRWVATGVLMLGGAAVITVAGAARSDATVILVGLVLGQLALVVLTPSIIGLLGRAGRVLPLAPRIALRDTARNRSSAAPAISAVMAVVAGSVMIGVYYSSGHARDVDDYRAALPEGYAAVTLTEYDRVGHPHLMSAAEIADLKGRVAGTMPVDHFITTSLGECAGPQAKPENPCYITLTMPPENVCPWSDKPPAADLDRARADKRCTGTHSAGGFMGYYVDDGTGLNDLTGADPTDLEAARAMLRDGGVVVGDSAFVSNGHTILEYADGTQENANGDKGKTKTVPAYALHSGPTGMPAIISPRLLPDLGLTPTPSVLVIATRRTPTTAEQDAFQAVLDGYGNGIWAYVEGGPDNSVDITLIILAVASALVTLAATAVVTGLAAADGRADLSTLGAVGAAPRVRRLMALSQSGVIAGLGTVLGVAAGVGAAFALIAAINRASGADAWPPLPPLGLAVPWSQLLIVLVVPLVAMLGAGMLTRSRLPIERRS
ncbi:FtsX-like permease family protein [Hamadaea tsunoensis]|uniref:FtsX-like permease family protein n=1 Tax=Hamadaea tsunoensis TaxID=53368 RepID=UPI000554E3DE|nr:FtsX-like permease family protein [Hamadaea tsunoensis]